MVWYVCGMVWYVLTVWYGKNTVNGMVRLRYGTIVRSRGCIIWLNLPGGMVSVYKVRKGRIRRTNIICHELISTIGKFENLVLRTDRQTDRQICIYQNRDSVLQTDKSVRQEEVAHGGVQRVREGREPKRMYHRHLSNDLATDRASHTGA